MEKRYKIPPCSIYDVPAMETWLSDLSRTGLHLKKTGKYLFSFQKGKPCDTEYRLEPIPNDYWKPADDMIDDYASAGWEFVTTSYQSFFIWRSTRPDAEELHSDPLIHSTAYKQLYTRLSKNAIISVILPFVILAIFLCGILLSPQPVTIFLAAPTMLFFILFAFVSGIQAVLQTATLRRLKQSLADGLPALHQKNYKKKLWPRRILILGAAMFMLFLIYLPIYMSILNWNKTTSEVDTALPYLPLDLIEKDSDFSWHTDTYIRDGIDSFNNVSYSWSLLVPVHYDIYQQGNPRKTYTNTDYNDVYVEPSARTEYFQLSLPFFAVPLYKERIRCYIHYEDSPTIRELHHPGFDYITIAKSNGYTQLFACHGKQVIHIQYWGNSDLSKLLNELSAALIATMDH